MRVRFHGTRGSHPVCITPARVREIARNVWETGRAQKCESWGQVEAALAAQPRRSQHQIYGGNTTCVEVVSDALATPFFFDVGTGFTTASMDENSALNGPAFRAGRGEATIFLTHTHWDHISGLITAPQIFVPGNKFHFYGVHANLSQRIASLFKPEHFPVPFERVAPSFEFHQIQAGDVTQIGRCRITHCPQRHPGGSFAYRIEDGERNFVFATDIDLKAPAPGPAGRPDASGVAPSFKVYANAHVMVVDAHFLPEDLAGREDYGHSEILSAVDFAVLHGTQRLYLFHQNPAYSDPRIDDQLARARKHLRDKHPGVKNMVVEMAVEGDEINV